MTLLDAPAVPLPRFDHLVALSDEIGTFEHAEHTTPRTLHGYCTDDVARVLLVAVREPVATAEIRALERTSLRFLVDAQGTSGLVRNRRQADGRWTGRRTTDDCWGRSLQALGTAARLGRDPWTRQVALATFGHSAARRSPWPRSMAFAALGAVEVLAADPHAAAARALLVDAVALIDRPSASARWPWPEPRLTYANATLPEALLAAGHALGRSDVVDRGLDLLGWLLERETLDGHLSPTPAGGAGPHDRIPAFDQQPIEVAAMADACARALAITGHARWADGLDLAVRWFLGENDAGTPMWDPATGGGYDGLHATTPNRNQGAESTIALISTLQQARRRSGRDAVV